jgi:hypothetical protein
MAQRASDREDLMCEATALIERAELKLPGFDEPIVVGFRRDGSASFFFGADPVYQFNSAGELRRAFVSGLLYKAAKGQLVALRRERTESQTLLISRELPESEAAAFLAAASERLRNLQDAMLRGEYEVTGQVPADGEVPRRIHQWLKSMPAAIPIARAPNVR